MELAATYAPQNIYCYAIDKKASTRFHQRVYSLAECFHNVIYTITEHDITRFGQNMGLAHYECLKLLMNYDWRYVVLLQVFFIYNRNR